MTPGELLWQSGLCVICHQPRELREFLLCNECNALKNGIARVQPGMGTAVRYHR